MRRILPILILMLFTAMYSYGQESRSVAPEMQGKFVKTYPNPATSYITFDLQNNYQKGLTIVVYSFLGKKMYESQNVSEKTTLTLSDFNRGVYIYHITDQSGKVMDSGKFQVSR
ncbi:MAG: T9SS type A sorting domain-containing protein [Bacteroidota bacterium]|nr:T9SS type A sorting domain-containing protein [Bacteroidota bacterium]